jgi:crotonobetainyl-CoA:carnitine CoA-transferase CaiB-like acyl-CoA transferase
LEDGETRGQRIQCEALETAMGGGDTRFTQRQWEGMGIDCLYMDQYVETGGKSYRPKGAKTTTGMGSVGSEFVKLCKVIYSEKVINEPAARELLRRMGRRKLLEATWKALEAGITEAELMKVMENLPEGKQAGPNRIPNEVYMKTLSTVFVPKMKALLEEAHKNGKLPSHFLEGDIAML